jgi:hypothetical protein
MRTRREFLVNCSSALAGGVLVPISVVRGTEVSAGDFISLSQISYSILASQVRTLFRVRHAPGRTVELTLIEAPLAPPAPPGTLGVPHAGASNERFSLIFSGPQETLLEPRTYRFEHTCVGRFEMYIGQIGPSDAGGVYYEAVVNRPAPVTLFAPRPMCESRDLIKLAYV